MSQQIFPALSGFPGLDWGMVKTPIFKTQALRSQSNRELRASWANYPLWKFSLKFNFLRSGTRGTDMQTIAGLFLLMHGSFDTFLFSDPDDNSETDQSIGIGDGATQTFQLVRTYGAGGFIFIEPIENVNAITNVKVAGSVTTSYTLGNTGILTFNTPPASGASITWSGTYYYRCRFMNDAEDFENFMKNLWSLGQLEFVGATGNKVGGYS